MRENRGEVMWETWKKCFKFGFWGAVIYSAVIFILVLVGHRDSDSIAYAISRPTIHMYEHAMEALGFSVHDWMSYLFFLPAWVFLFGFILCFIISFAYQAAALLGRKVFATKDEET